MYEASNCFTIGLGIDSPHIDCLRVTVDLNEWPYTNLIAKESHVNAEATRHYLSHV